MSPTNEQSSFLQSPYTLWATLVRCACVFGLACPTEWLPWVHSRALQSTLVDGVFTLQHVREATALRNVLAPRCFVAAYKGGSIHLPPLLLAWFEPLLRMPESSQHVVLGIFLIGVDFVIAWALERLGILLVQQKKTTWEDDLQEKVPEAIQPKLAHIFQLSKEKKAMISLEDIPLLMAQLYYCSPITCLTSCLVVSFQNVPVVFAMIALLNACQGSLIWCSLSLAIASYINVHYFIFLVPAVILIRERRTSIPVFLFSFVALAAALQALSFHLIGRSNYLYVVSMTHGWSFQIQGIEPSLSTLWYVGMEMFDRFSIYFTILLGGAPYLLVVPLWIRLYRYPEAMIALFWLLGTLFRPPATLYSLNVAICLLLLSPRSLARLKVIPSLIAVSAIMIPVSLYVVNTWLWLDTGSGEANFMYFQCLAYNAFVAIIFVQFVSACLRRDKALRLTEKIILEGDISPSAK